MELADEGLLSQTEREAAETEYLRKQHEVGAASGELAASQLRLVEYRTALIDLKRQHREQTRELRLALRGTLNDLRGALRRWETNHVLAAPISGHVSFLRALDAGVFVGAGEALMAVVPSERDAIARMTLPQTGAGRVRVGQRAILRLDAYPVNEFGFVSGRVSRISLLPTQRVESEQAVYLVAIELPEGLKTSHGIELDFRQEMEGGVEIVTDDLRLFQRLFQQLRHVHDRAFDA
jgi:multidrug resistance efflux pump